MASERRGSANGQKRCSVVDIDGKLVFNENETALKTYVIEHLDEMARFWRVHMFLLGPKFNFLRLCISSNGEAGQDQIWTMVIYGDMGSAERAKTQCSIYIDCLHEKLLML